MTEENGASAKETQTQTAKRNRKWPWVVLALLVVLLTVAAIVIVPIIRRPPTTRTDWPDYSGVVAQWPKSPMGRYPADKQMRRFPILWPTRPPEENALVDYLRAMKAFSTTMQAPAGSAESADEYAGDIGALREWVEANQPAFDAIEEAIEKDYLGVPVFVGPKGMPAPDIEWLSGSRRLTRLCTDAGFLAELEGRPDDAAAWYVKCLRMGRHRRKGITIDNLVSAALTSIGAGNLEHLIANTDLSEATLREIMAECGAGPPVLEEIAFVLDAEEEYFRAHPAILKIGAEFRNHSMRNLNRARRNFATPLSELVQREDAGEWLANGHPRESLWRWRGELARREVRLQALKLRAALALYRTRHGSFPEALDQLSPDILPAIPLDPFTNKPFAYESDGKTWELRSSGPDGIVGNEEEVSPSQLRGQFSEEIRKFDGTALPLDYIFLFALDSTENVRRGKHPKADARWRKLHPQPPRPKGLPPE